MDLLRPLVGAAQQRLDEAAGERGPEQLQLEEALGEARAALGRFQRDPVPDALERPLAEPRP
jgi:hypothetical protein